MINLDPALLGVLSFIAFIALLILGLPIGMAMALMGFCGIWMMKGSTVALNALFQLPFSAISSWLLSVIPMFILMGYIAFYAGFTRDAYDAAYKWVGRFPGGLAIATLIGAALFGACSGSSVAATAALGKVALPEMERYHYDRRLAAGTVAMGGTLDALIPPSILLVLYGVITEESIAKLLIAGILPGILSMVCFILLVIFRVLLRPELAPRGEKFSWKERFLSLKGTIGIGIIFVAIIGGLYTGIFTPTEAGAVGAFACLILSLVMRRMEWMNFQKVVYDSLKVFSSIFLIILVYLILGCFMDALGLLFLTVPFIFPAVVALGFNPIWFGIIVVKMLEIGLITPPVGIQAYVLKSVAPNISLSDIFRGFLPFFLVDLFIVIGLLTLFPQIVTFLPSMMK